jgi:hypothetical protein
VQQVVARDRRSHIGFSADELDGVFGGDVLHDHLQLRHRAHKFAQVTFDEYLTIARRFIFASIEK